MLTFCLLVTLEYFIFAVSTNWDYLTYMLAINFNITIKLLFNAFKYFNKLFLIIVKQDTCTWTECIIKAIDMKYKTHVNQCKQLAK